MTTTSQTLVEARALRRGFGGHMVLDGVELAIAPGSVHGLVGLNGAGKTTLMRLLLGLLKADSGSVNLLGDNPWEHCPATFAQVGVVLENDGFFPNLTFMQSLRFYAQARGVSARELDTYLEQWWGDCALVRSSTRARHFSRGQRMQSALCRAFMDWPRVCLLDEPTVGLDIEAYEQFYALVREARARGCAVMISSHQLSAIDDLCDSVGLLRDGKLTALDHGRGEQEWYVEAAGDGDFAAAVMACGVTQPIAEGAGWRLGIPSSRTTVPSLVASLVAGGWQVHQVRPVARSVKRALKGGGTESGAT